MRSEFSQQEAAVAALPGSTETSGGLFAWGFPLLKSGRLGLAWAEFLTVFVIFPVAAILIDAINMIPLTIACILSSTCILLSMSRSFHWRDLLPVDPWSEVGFFLRGAAGLAATMFVITSLVAPDRLFVVESGVLPMLIAFPLLTAFPIELVYRALFFRRFGHLFHNECNAVVVGALANGLIYYVLSDSVAAAMFGIGIGAFLGWVYLRTGQFALSVMLHWTAALCIWLIGPGFSVF